MKRKTRGFTLVELTFVIVVMLILAAMIIGGASYIMNQARGQTAVDQARSIRLGVENYMGRRRVAEAPGAAGGMTAAQFRAAMLSYMGTTTSTDMQNPYAGGTIYSVPVTDVTGVPMGTVITPDGAGTNTSYGSTDDFPKNDNNHRGMVRYFVNTNVGTPPGHFAVWNGTELQEFTYFAVQAYDDQGAPLITVGR